MSTKSKKSQNRNTHKKTQFQKEQSLAAQKELYSELVVAVSAFSVGTKGSLASFTPATYIKGLTPKNIAGFLEVSFPAVQLEQMSRFLFVMKHSPVFAHVEYLATISTTDKSDIELIKNAGVSTEQLMTMVFAVCYRTSSQKAAA